MFLGQLCNDDCEVLLSKKKLVVTKNNKQILHGDRNKSDGLWDIKISYYEAYKIKLQSNNFINPPTHASMYIGNNNFTTKTTVTQETNNVSPIKIIFINDFKGLEEVVATNECTYLVDRQLKKDRIKKINPAIFKQVQVSSPTMSVIIRKNETKIDVIKFLHAALFSSVKSPLVRAIHNNHLTTWPSLAKQILNRHLIPNINTAKEHLKQERQNL